MVPRLERRAVLGTFVSTTELVQRLLSDSATARLFIPSMNHLSTLQQAVFATLVLVGGGGIPPPLLPANVEPDASNRMRRLEAPPQDDT